MVVYSCSLFGRSGFLVDSAVFMNCGVNLVGKIIPDYYFFIFHSQRFQHCIIISVQVSIN